MWKNLNFNLIRSVPLTLQTESSECGLACLTMILNYYKDNTDLFSLRQRYHISSHGTNLKQLVLITKELGLESRALSLQLEEMKSLVTPCILHWEFNHFVVLVQVKRKYFIIHDPAFGKRKVTYSEMSKYFTGVALELFPSVQFKPKNERNRIEFREIIDNLKGVREPLLKVFSLSIVIEIISLLMPIGIQIVMDHVIKSDDYILLYLICFGLFFFYIFNSLLSALRAWIKLKFDTVIGFQWEISFFSHLLKLPLSFFEKRQLGDIQSRFNSLETLHDTIISSILVILIDSIIIFSVLIMMIFYGGFLVWIILFFLLVYLVMRIITYVVYRQTVEESIIKSAKVDSHFMESLYGIASLKSLGIIDIRQKYWTSLVVDQVNTSIKISKFDLLFSGIDNFLDTIEQILILGIGAYLVMQNNMTLGMFIAFNSYSGTFSSKVGGLINTFFSLKMLSLHMERVSDIALTEKENDVYHHLDLDNLEQAGICVKNLRFQYDKFSNPIFEGLNFEIKAGECVAIVAPSGFGKTTLLKIMSGLISDYEGKVLFNQLDISKIGIEYYRSKIASVLQEDKLFSGSIIDNITSFSDNIDRDWMITCAKLSQIHDEIIAMPMGYETIVSELGTNLSGGQKQRLCIARALYKKPKILFLDEATSHLDIENEEKINNSIKQLNITRVIVAHRQSTIDSADRIIKLDTLMNL